jgi:polygalacturonase
MIKRKMVSLVSVVLVGLLTAQVCAETFDVKKYGAVGDGKTIDSPAMNRAIALKLCRNVVIHDVTFLTCGHFGILPAGVDNFTIDNVKARAVAEVPTFVLKNVENFATHQCQPVADTKLDRVEEKEL